MNRQFTFKVTLKWQRAMADLSTVLEMAGLDVTVENGSLSFHDTTLNLVLTQIDDQNYHLDGQFLNQRNNDSDARTLVNQLALALEADGIDFHMELLQDQVSLLLLKPQAELSATQLAVKQTPDQQRCDR